MKRKPRRKSGKTKYDTHEKAAVAAGEIITQTHAMTSKKWSHCAVLWTYKCNFCNHWHLTSKDPNTG